jgi:6-pyruvoyltetrahydropterin/6-carboxytetrahydropterin synthase
MVVAFWKLLERKLPPGLLYEVRLHETENNMAIYRGE